MKLYDIVTQNYFDYVASGTQMPNGSVIQNVGLTDSNGDPIFLVTDDTGNVGVNVNGATFTIEGNLTVDTTTLAKESGGNLATIAGAITNNGVNISEIGGSVPLINPVRGTLQDGAIATGNGTIINIGPYSGLRISISGANVTSSEVDFYHVDEIGNVKPVQGVNPATATSTANKTTGICTGANTPGEDWIFDVKGLNQFKARIAAIAGASASITVLYELVL